MNGELLPVFKIHQLRAAHLMTGVEAEWEQRKAAVPDPGAHQHPHSVGPSLTCQTAVCSGRVGTSSVRKVQEGFWCLFVSVWSEEPFLCLWSHRCRQWDCCGAKRVVRVSASTAWPRRGRKRGSPPGLRAELARQRRCPTTPQPSWEGNEPPQIKGF